MQRQKAIQNFTANLSQILLMDDKGIRVNAVAPGADMDTANPLYHPKP